jgi:hypothetical protein
VASIFRYCSSAKSGIGSLLGKKFYQTDRRNGRNSLSEGKEWNQWNSIQPRSSNVHGNGLSDSTEYITIFFLSFSGTAILKSLGAGEGNCHLNGA